MNKQITNRNESIKRQFHIGNEQTNEQKTVNVLKNYFHIGNGKKVNKKSETIKGYCHIDNEQTNEQKRVKVLKDTLTLAMKKGRKEEKYQTISFTLVMENK